MSLVNIASEIKYIRVYLKHLSSLLLLLPLFVPLKVKAADEPLLFLGNHDIPPMIYLTDTGPEGMVIDLAKAIIDKADINANVDAIDWGAAQNKLKSGTADALLQINSNPEREKIFDFSEPLLLSEFTIFRRSDRVDLQNIESLYGRSVGVEKKGYPISILKKHPEINAVIIPSWSLGFHKLSNGEIDAVIVDRWVGEFELSKLGLTNIAVNKRPVEASYSTIAVRKGNDELLASINSGIRQIRADGSYDRILENWQNFEVIYLTREQRFLYIASFILMLFVTIIIGGFFYVRRISVDNQLQSELNSKLESKNDELLQFAYRTSHDLKSPLTSSKHLLKFIAKDMESGNIDEAKRNAKIVEGQMEKLENLIVSVLDMAAAEFKEQEIELLDFQEIMQEIKERFALNLDQTDCSVDLIDQTSRSIYLPKVRLSRIIENIVSNGIKYQDKNKSDPFVKVNIANDTDYLIITIEDNGMGIPEKYQDKVFGMFQRAHPDAEGGSGLGLNIVLKHLQVLNGTIQLTSVVNEGSRFEIKIPL